VTPLTIHAFSLLNNAGSSGDQPPSYTITDFDGEEWRQLAACQLNGLNIKATDIAHRVHLRLDGEPSITPSTPTPSYTGVKTPAPWTFALFLGGTQIPYCTDWEIDLTRDTKPIPGLTGTQEYFLYFANALKSTGKLTLVEQSGSPWLNDYLNGTVQTFDLTVFDNVAERL